MPIRPLLLVASLAGLLAGCATTPPPEPDPPAVRGTLYDLGEGAPDPVAIGFALITPEFLTLGGAVADLARADLIEPVPGVWMGAFATPAGNAFEVVLPDPDELPAAALVPLADAVLNFGACTVDAAPVSARATYTLFEGITVPGLAALTYVGSGLMLATAAEFDADLPLDDQGASFQGWIYVDRAATLEVSGCTFVADLSFAEGWNQLAWTFDEASIVVTVVAEADVFAALQLPFPPVVVSEEAP